MITFINYMNYFHYLWLICVIICKSVFVSNSLLCLHAAE